MTLPLARVSVGLGYGELQTVRVDRPFGFETQLPTSNLPWMIVPGAVDRSGLVRVSWSGLRPASLRREGDEVVVSGEAEALRVPELRLS